MEQGKPAYFNSLMNFPSVSKTWIADSAIGYPGCPFASNAKHARHRFAGLFPLPLDLMTPVLSNRSTRDRRSFGCVALSNENVAIGAIVSFRFIQQLWIDPGAALTFRAERHQVSLVNLHDGMRADVGGQMFPSLSMRKPCDRVKRPSPKDRMNFPLLSNSNKEGFPRVSTHRCPFESNATPAAAPASFVSPGNESGSATAT
jgi:hypothetical protein